MQSSTTGDMHVLVPGSALEHGKEGLGSLSPLKT